MIKSINRLDVPDGKYYGVTHLITYVYMKY